MLRELESWVENHETEKKSCQIEFWVKDFYGPFIRAKIEKNGNVKVWPEKLTIEDASETDSDLHLLGQMSEEIFEKYGKFTLILPLFKVEIDSKYAEEAITEKLLQIKLF